MNEDPNRIDAVDRAYNEAMEAEAAASTTGRRRLLRGRSPRTRSVVLAAGVLAIGISPFAVAATGDALREGQRNGTTSRETEIVANINSTTAQKGGYSTRQSNLSASGGGAIYGCRSRAGGSAANPPQNPCLRANNLSSGYAFEFNAQNGAVAGLFSVGNGGDSKKPFITNATGVATGLNADRVDGLDGAQITGALAALAGQISSANQVTERFITVRENPAGNGAEIIAQSGGFTLVNCYQANGNCYINAGGDVTNRGITTEIITDNTSNAAGAQGPEFLSGETSAAPCGAGYVACGPDGTENDNTFVVTPRNSNGTQPPGGDRYGFTAVVSSAGSTGAPDDAVYTTP